MKVKQSDVKVGDTLLMAKFSMLTLIKIIGITKSGSLKYTFSPRGGYRSGINKDYYDGIEEDVSKHTKTAYIRTPYRPEYEAYFWLLSRENNG